MIRIMGQLFDGKSSKSSAATLEITANKTVQFKSANNESSIPSKALNISSRLGHSSRYIDIEGVGRFETSNNTAVDELAALLGGDKNTGLLHRLESNLGLITLAIVATIGFVWLMIRVGVPGLGDYIVDQLPDKTTDYLEEQLISKLEEQWFDPSGLAPARQAELQALFQQVKASLNVSEDYQFKLYDASHSFGANAVAFPSGTIVMTDQLVELVNSDEQLAGVIAHEIGHLDGKHSLRQIVRGSIVTFLVAWVSGDVSGASSLVITAPTLLLQMKYSREFETEADEYALRYIGCNKGRLKLMSEFFLLLDEERHKQIDQASLDVDKTEEKIVDKDKTRETSGQSDFWSSHPASKKRSEKFRQHYTSNCL